MSSSNHQFSGDVLVFRGGYVLILGPCTLTISKHLAFCRCVTIHLETNTVSKRKQTTINSAFPLEPGQGGKENQKGWAWTGKASPKKTHQDSKIGPQRRKASFIFVRSYCRMLLLLPLTGTLLGVHTIVP